MDRKEEEQFQRVANSTEDPMIVSTSSGSDLRSSELTLPQATLVPNLPSNLGSPCPVSASLAKWTQKAQASRQASLKRLSVKSVLSSGPSPVASRTRTGLKRASSFSDEDYQSGNNVIEFDRTCVSLRKALVKRTSSENPSAKKGKRSVEP